MKPLLQINKLGVSYLKGKGAHALRDVTLSLYEGECLGIVGESGSGKTTLAYAVLGILPASASREGQIYFKGNDIFSLDKRSLLSLRRNNISIIFQEPGACFNPVFTIEYQFKEYLYARGAAGGWRSLCEGYLHKAGLSETGRIMKSYPHQLSGGQLQRVMIAMAVSVRPQLLIADEPTSSLDVTVESQIINLLKELRKELGLSILFITHNLGLVDILCGRVAVLQQGIVREVASKDALFKSPAHEYTKSLITSYQQINQT